MRIIRVILGALILFFDKIFTPRGIKRDAETQAAIDEKTTRLSLYQFKACPFCVKVRRMMKRNNLNIKTVDAKHDETNRNELLEGGGKIKVPCLRIKEQDGDVRWVYESSEIISYLEGQFPTMVS
jgi:glutaredoxin